MKEIRAISVIGLGRLGLCMATSFADKGFKVIGVDIDKHKVDMINSAESPIQETGLADLIRRSKNNLKATTDFIEAIKSSQVSFIVVATPTDTDGSFSNKQLEGALQEIAKVTKEKDEYHLIVITSTIMPGTTEGVAKTILEAVSEKRCGIGFGLAYNPEFIALGSVIHDFLNPDFILIGEINRKDGDMLEEIYKKVCENKPRFARMNPVNAEITKMSLNCYITTKITFANSLATVCEKVKGADAYIIAKALGLDSRIGSKYFKPGLGYGGPCFPRDNVAFSAFARRLEIRGKLTEAVNEVNREQASRIVNRIRQILFDLNKDKRSTQIGILGLSYKPDTPIIEDSQALAIVQLLVNEGYSVSVYDPQAQENVRGVLGDRVIYAKNSEDCLSNVNLGIIAVPWEEFKKIDLRKLNKNAVLLDCWRLLDASKGVNIEFLGVGI